MKLAFRSSLLLLFGTLLAHAHIASFKHVIVIVQENRTPDNLFQGLCRPPFGTSESCSTTPNATQYNIQTSNWLDKHSPTGVTQPLPVPLGNTYDRATHTEPLTANAMQIHQGHAEWTGQAMSPAPARVVVSLNSDSLRILMAVGTGFWTRT
jgi:phospholipase C